jgi:hypothetical protein
MNPDPHNTFCVKNFKYFPRFENFVEKYLIPTLAKPDPDLINCKVGAGSGPGSEQQGNKSNPDPHQQDADPHKGLGDHFSP